MSKSKVKLLVNSDVECKEKNFCCFQNKSDDSIDGCVHMFTCSHVNS